MPNLKLQPNEMVSNRGPTFFHTRQVCDQKPIEAMKEFQPMASPVVASSKYKNSGFLFEHPNIGSSRVKSKEELQTGPKPFDR